MTGPWLWTLDGALGAIVGAPGEPVDDDETVCVAICVAALPDGVHFAVGDNQTRSTCTTSMGRSSTPSGHTCTLFSLAVTPDGQHIISGDSDGPVKVWHVTARAS